MMLISLLFLIIRKSVPKNSHYWSYKEALIKNIILKSNLLAEE